LRSRVWVRFGKPLDDLCLNETRRNFTIVARRAVAMLHGPTPGRQTAVASVYADIVYLRWAHLACRRHAVAWRLLLRDVLCSVMRTRWNEWRALTRSFHSERRALNCFSRRCRALWQPCELTVRHVVVSVILALVTPVGVMQHGPALLLAALLTWGIPVPLHMQPLRFITVGACSLPIVWIGGAVAAYQFLGMPGLLVQIVMVPATLFPFLYAIDHAANIFVSLSQHRLGLDRAPAAEALGSIWGHSFLGFARDRLGVEDLATATELMITKDYLCIGTRTS